MSDITRLQEENATLAAQRDAARQHVKELQIELALYGVQLAATDARSQDSFQTYTDACNRHTIEMEKMQSEINELRRHNNTLRVKHIARRRKNDAMMKALVHHHDRTVFDLWDRIAALQKERARRDTEEEYRKIEQQQLLTWLLAVVLPTRLPWLLLFMALRTPPTKLAAELHVSLRADRIAISMLYSADQAAAEKAAADQAAAEKAAADKATVDQADDGLVWSFNRNGISIIFVIDS